MNLHSACALFLGHPGHELRVFGLMVRNKALVNVITDGSGANRASRFDSTRALVEGGGGRLGFLPGSFSDRAFYELALSGDPEPFIDLARKLAAELAAENVGTVAGDMLEGFNVTHDLCRMIINAAVEKLRARGRVVLNLEFPLEAILREGESENCLVVRLDDETFARKRHAALVAYPELAGEVDRLISKFGEDAFRVEILHSASVPAGLTWDLPDPPFYETYGRRQVASGHYQRLITYRDHIQPLALAIWNWAKSDAK